MSRRIKRVKHRDGKTTIDWMEPNGNHEQAASLTDCPDKPKPSFLAALEEVEKIVLKMVGITGQSFSKALTVTGLTVSVNVNGRRSFKPSAYLQTAYGGGTGISLPLMHEAWEDEEGPHLLNDVALKKFQKFLEEGVKYSHQARVQTELDLDSTGTD